MTKDPNVILEIQMISFNAKRTSSGFYAITCHNINDYAKMYGENYKRLEKVCNISFELDRSFMQQVFALTRVNKFGFFSTFSLKP